MHHLLSNYTLMFEAFQHKQAFMSVEERLSTQQELQRLEWHISNLIIEQNIDTTNLPIPHKLKLLVESKRQNLQKLEQIQQRKEYSRESAFFNISQIETIETQNFAQPITSFIEIQNVNNIKKQQAFQQLQILSFTNL
jgi:hypothetical protein